MCSDHKQLLGEVADTTADPGLSEVAEVDCILLDWDNLDTHHTDYQLDNQDQVEAELRLDHNLDRTQKCRNHSLGCKTVVVLRKGEDNHHTN